MMLKRMLGSAAITLTALLAMPANAQVLIGNFEGANGTNTDGWTANNDGGTTAVLSNVNSAAVATLDAAGLRIVGGAGANGNTGNFWMMNIDNGDRPTLAADIAANRMLKADVTFVATQFDEVTNNWAQFNKIAVNNGAGWQEVNPVADPGWNASLGNLTYTYTWDLSGVNVPDTASGAFTQIHMSANFDRPSFGAAGQPPIPAFFVDNIRLEGAIPEPTAAALAAFALGGLALLRRRK
jgi:hypothetical protein